jgi:glycerophosphoryl diester phosphodiesterase
MNSNDWIVLGLAATTLALSCGPGQGSKTARPAFANGGLLAAAAAVPEASLAALRGQYAVASGQDRFGTMVAIDHAPGTVSLFAAPNAAYAVTSAGCIEGGTRLVLEGYWRYATSDDTGLVRLFAGPPVAAQALCAGIPTDTAGLELSGSVGADDAEPSDPFRLVVQAPLRGQGAIPFRVVAHRGGCRTSDNCGASENSVEVIGLAQSLGAGAIEIDVRTTSDGVAVLYHDDNFGPRLTEGVYCHGPVSDFTFAHVQALCQLSYGEQIPTLDDALQAVLDRTTLRAVWLDVKTVSAMAPSIAAARRFTDLAAAAGRQIQIVVGLGDSDLLDAYLQSARPPGTSCLVELEPDDARRAGCRVWAPRWTRGPMSADVRQMQSEGFNVAFWTLDEPEFIDVFLEQAHPNGLLTNRPGLVFQRFQAIGVQPEGPVP